jgi:hypothetical protein
MSRDKKAGECITDVREKQSSMENNVEIEGKKGRAKGRYNLYSLIHRV